MNKDRLAFLLGLGLLSSISLHAQAKSFRVDQLPNEGGFDCATCHQTQTNRSRNPFGLDVEVTLNRNNVNWSNVFFLDSDGDGYSNGRELGDPCGLWLTGRTPERTSDISNPGDRYSIPPGDPGPTCTCGNGSIDPGEECDDGNLIHKDRCSNECQETTCGDGKVDAGELCDDGNDDNTDDCLTICVFAECGDGFVHQGHEPCDDGNLSNSDDCLNTCVPASCGDNYRWVGHEPCDQGSNNSDTVANACRPGCIAPYCGDGVMDEGERCDDGTNLEPENLTLCTTACPQPQCGNGAVEFGEQCDDGNANDNTKPNACRETCRSFACGDFVVDSNEECDDGPIGSNQCSGNCVSEIVASENASCTCVLVKPKPQNGIYILAAGLVLGFVRRKLK